MMNCVFCKKNFKFDGKVSRQDTCPHCNRDLRCCMQCRFYDKGAYNECREVLAELIVDKERSNYCDYFVPRGSKEKGGRLNRTKDAKKALEALFNKKK